MDVTDDSNDGAVGVCHVQRLPERVLPREEAPRDGLVDDHDRGRTLTVARLEEAALLQRDAKRAVIAAVTRRWLTVSSPPRSCRPATVAGRLHGPAERHATDTYEACSTPGALLMRSTGISWKCAL